MSTRNTGVAPAIRRMKLRHPELSEAQIASRVGCAPSNVHYVLKRFLANTDTEEDLQRYQEEKANIFDALQLRFLSSITQADIEKAPLLARVTAAGIVEDKARTIRGQATNINVSVLLDAVQAAKDLHAQRSAEALAAVRKRMASEADQSE